MKNAMVMVAGVVAAMVLAGCQNHDSYQQQPHYSSSQSGYSSKLGKLGSAPKRTHHATNIGGVITGGAKA